MGLFSRFKKSENSSKKLRSATLTVLQHEKLTTEGCKITFSVPAELKEQFSFSPGQYLNLHCPVNGTTVSRSYSICSGTNENLAVAVKAIPNGLASNWLLNELKEGMSLEVDFPQGNFQLNNGTGNIVAFAAGSGITPILSMAKSLVGTTRKMTLYYVNSSPENAFFINELKSIPSIDLKLFFSRTIVEGAGNGRFDKQTVSEIIKSDLSILRSEGFYICGPEEMIIGIQEVLHVFGVDKSTIHFELFTTPVLMQQEAQEATHGTFSGMSAVSAILDGEVVNIQLNTEGKSILDALDNAGMDVPFSCKGGVCCTCKAKIIEGSAKMTINYALTDEEVKEGYVLTCQAHPTSEVLKLDFDV